MVLEGYGPKGGHGPRDMVLGIWSHLGMVPGGMVPEGDMVQDGVYGPRGAYGPRERYGPRGMALPTPPLREQIDRHM